MRKILLLAFIPSLLAAQGGSSGAGFLKLGMGPRAGAMGEAYVAVADDAGGLYYNPAGIALTGSSGISVAHRAWIAGIQSQSLNASVPWGSAALGVNVVTTSVPDIEIRTRPGDPEGTFTSRDFALGASFAYRITDDVTAGATAKYVFEKIFVDEWSGLGVDLGVHYRSPIERLAFGVSVSNIGSMTASGNPSIGLPTTLRFGAAYTIPTGSLQSEVTLSADAVDLTRDGIFHANFGGEILFDRTIAVRAGYQTGYDFRGFSAGLGIMYKAFALSYCILPMSQDAGTAQTVGLDITL